MKSNQAMKDFGQAQSTLSKLCDKLPGYLSRLRSLENDIRSGKVVPDSQVDRAIHSGRLFFRSLENACRKMGDAESAFQDHEYIPADEFGIPILLPMIIIGLIGASGAAAYIAKRHYDNADRELELIEEGKLKQSVLPQIVFAGVAAGMLVAIATGVLRKKKK